MRTNDKLVKTIDWGKCDGLVPAIVQDAEKGTVLMLGYMNTEALLATQESGFVTFWSRSRKCLWKKGETSGNLLRLVNVESDCDNDALLVRASPVGPTCHTGSSSCFGQDAAPPLAFFAELDGVLSKRFEERPANSYTTSLIEAGRKRMAQKVGEEGVEVALASSDEELVEESADLLFHLMVLLKSQGLRLPDVAKVLRARHSNME
ncbi:MAG: bifunctional phosphoribosyl-AMP cyclohydrolase/phosphoribosyl-ATP diphosphatase HisIE [Kofleriaceae bacterium]|nr:bifunctional phosphoribosyl-AMP cyclohydrolase/phosphoribosyl-ATP diphosphatase HisIE [Kofleriaceae bacterium]